MVCIVETYLYCGSATRASSLILAQLFSPRKANLEKVVRLLWLNLML